MVSIIIPTYINFNGLQKLVDSIIEHTNFYDREVIIVANGAPPEERVYLEELSKKIITTDEGIEMTPFRYLWFNEPLGYPKAVNEGVKAANPNAGFFVLLNDDCQFTPQDKNEWIDYLFEPFTKDSYCGITGALMSHSVGYEFIIFFIAMISRRVIDSIGYLDESFTVGAGEDTDYCIKATKAGFNMYQVPMDSGVTLGNGKMVGTFPIYHEGEATVFNIPNVDWKQHFEDNTLKLQNRYVASEPVAVIIPARNGESTLRRALDSVYAQRHGEMGVFICDDNSEDSTEKIISEYEENVSLSRGVRIFSYGNNDKRYGQSYTRNKLIAEAIRLDYKYIAFLDADDMWYPGHIRERIDSVKANNVDLVYGDPVFKGQDGGLLTPQNITNPNEFSFDKLRQGNYIWISGVVAKSEIFVGEEFDSELNGVEDWDMWYRLAQKGVAIKKDNNITFEYYVNPEGEAALTKSETIQKVKDKHDLDRPLIKLNVACGEDYREGYINSDLYPSQTDKAVKLDAIYNCAVLPYDDNSVDEVRASHIIEHFDFHEGQEVLKEWYRVLRPGGKLWIETPDLLTTCQAFVNADEQFRIMLYGHFFAMPWEPGQTHKFLFTESQLTTQLQWAGFKRMKRVQPESWYVRPDTKELFLAMEAYK